MKLSKTWTIAVATLGIAAPVAQAHDTVRNCGNIAPTARALGMWDITSRNIGCQAGRLVARLAFKEAGAGWTLIDEGWLCHASYDPRPYETYTMRCTRRNQAIRFHSGV
jgi:hypothetical protein